MVSSAKPSIYQSVVFLYHADSSYPELSTLEMTDDIQACKDLIIYSLDKEYRGTDVCT
jgi:hypothetical protein